MSSASTATAIVPQRPAWAQALSFCGCFLGAIALGSGIGAMLQPEGDATTAVLIFALLAVFIGGMALWGTIAASIMAKAIFNGDLARALLRFFLRGRRREDLPRLALDPEKLRAAGLRVFGWTRVFVWLAVTIAFVAAPLAGWFATTGFAIAAVVTGCAVVGYGCVVRALARNGYLIPPDVE